MSVADEQTRARAAHTKAATQRTDPRTADNDARAGGANAAGSQR